MKFASKQKSSGVEVEYSVSIGKDIAGALKKFGEEVVFGKYVAGCTAAIKARADGLLCHSGTDRHVEASK